MAYHEDPIVEEIHRVRRKIMEECDHDLDKFVERIRRVEARHSERLVRGSPKPLHNPRTQKADERNDQVKT